METIKNIIFYIIVFVLLAYVGLSLFKPEKVIDYFQFRPFVVLTSSMEPVIEINDVIILTKPIEEELQEGDIISFLTYIPELQKRSYVTHYIGKIEVNDQGQTIYKTIGEGKDDDDYDEWEDALGSPTDVVFDDIEGVYQFKIPLIGYMSVLFSNRLLLGLVVINGAVIYFTIAYIRKKKID